MNILCKMVRTIAPPDDWWDSVIAPPDDWWDSVIERFDAPLTVELRCFCPHDLDDLLLLVRTRPN